MNVSQSKLCLSCMQGRIEGGICNHCGKPEVKPGERKADALPLNHTLAGRYVVGNVVGSGGFGITYAAWDSKYNCRVAIKELYPAKLVTRLPDRHTVQVNPGNEAYYGEMQERFQMEARLLLQMKHIKEIPAVYKLFNENGTSYYAMEFLDGMDLRHYMERHGRLNWQQLAPHIHTVLRALEQLHSANLIHRDISPDNIFITSDGRARLIDFGTVRAYMGTSKFTTLLKEEFAPPEQYRSKGHQGPWTDIYALSVSIYYLLSGKLPPKATERVYSNLPVPPLNSLCPAVPPGVVAAVHKGMEMEIQDRFQSAREYSNALFGGNPIPKYSTAGPGTRAPDGYGASQSQAMGKLVCIQGYYKGKHWLLKRGMPLSIGRQPMCEIAYPQNAPGISGFQCSMMVDQNGQLWVRDDKSRYGTRLNQDMLPPQIWKPASKGSIISFAQEFYQIQ